MKNSQKSNRFSRKPARSSIGMAVVATLIASGAHAADTTYGPAAGSEVVNGGQGIALLQQNNSTVSAEGNNSQVGQTYQANIPTSGGNSGLVDGNVVGARAIGNDFDNSIGLALINSDPSATVQTGSAILGRSINNGDITSLVFENSLTIWDEGTDQASSSRTISNNSISADSFGNRGVSSIAGPVPNMFSSTIAGGSETSGTGFTANGGIVVTSVQETNATAGATAEDNNIELRLTSTDITAINAEDSGALLTGNTISATVNGNRAASVISIEAGGAPAFAGSAVVSNLQSGNQADANALNAGSNIEALVDSTGIDPNSLEGVVTVSNNAITSAATGNDALGTSAAPGNRIVLGDGISFDGPGISGGSVVSSDGSANSGADLVIRNLQTTTDSAISSTTEGGLIRAGVDEVNGGSIALSDNRITASATGNAAAGALEGGDNVASFVGAVALANQQINNAAPVTTLNTGASIVVETGSSNAATLSLADSSTTATARGNQSSQNLALNANTLPLSGFAIADASAVEVSAFGGATVANLQSNIDAPVTATLDTASSHVLAQTVEDSTLSNADSLQEAGALGNSASNVLALSGTAVGGGAGVGSVQTGDVASTVTATVENAGAEVAAFDVSGSTMSITNGAQRAVGYGNSVSNTLSIAANDFAPLGGISISNTGLGVTASSSGAAAVSSLQSQEGSVSVDNISSEFAVSADEVSTSSLSVAGSRQEAAALSNSASNTLNVTANSVSGGVGAASVQVGGEDATVVAGLLGATTGVYAEQVLGQSALSVNNSAQRATGYGNSASNTLAIEANDFAGSSIVSLSTNSPGASVSGAATLVNEQARSASVLADNLGSFLEVNVDGSADQSTLTVNGNAQESTALGNSASNALSLSGTTVGAGVGLSSTQRNVDGASVSATLSESQSTIYSADDITNSTATVSGNAQRAMANGNSASNAVTVSANDFAAGSGMANLSVNDTSVLASGAAVLTNLQNQTAAPVLAETTNAFIGLEANSDIESSTASVTGNTQEAMALGSRASNAVTISGTTVGAGSGIANVQRGDADATVTATLQDARVTVGVQENDVEDSTLSVSNNLQRAIGYGNSAANALSVTANAVSVDRTTTPSVVDSTASELAPSVVASYGVLNAQTSAADVTATSTSSAGWGSSRIGVGAGGSGDNVERSRLLNENNALVAAAYGNESSSRIDLLGASSISSGSADTDLPVVANVTSTQAMDASISAMADGQAAALTTFGGVLEDSTLSTSGNSVNAQAMGNLANNLLNVAQTGNIDTPVDGTTGTLADTADLRTNASFSVQNVQSALGTVTATHQDQSLSTEVRVEIGSNVTNSSAFADRNSSTASATSNSAVNALGLDAGNMASSTAVQNVQTTSADVNALIGSAATPGTLAEDFTGGGSGTTTGTVGVTDGGGVTTLNLNANSSASINFGTLSGNERNALVVLLQDAGFTVSGNTATVTTGGTAQSFDVSFFDQFTYSNNSITFAGFSAPAMPGTAARGGVMMAVGGDVIDSTLSVAGNMTNGSAVGNRAVNTNLLKGNTVSSGSTLTSAVVDQTAGSVQASADHALSNVQSSMADTIATDVNGVFAIDAQPEVVISNATLRVSGNSQTATARGNTATNELALEGNSLTAVLALQSTQFGSTAVDAQSAVQMFAPAEVTNSSVTLADNVNTARAVLNNASNTLSVSGTNVGSSMEGSIDLTPTVTSISAEQVLSNSQSATGSVTSDAVTTLYNQGLYTNGSASLIDSTLTITGNTTQAVALANQALNSATVSAGTQAASVALSNSQDSIESVTASAVTTANVALRGGAVALNNGSVVVGGNNTTALAAGNYADNVLNSLAGNAYGAASGGTVDMTASLSVNANAGILNRQTNAGAVSASSTDATHFVALNSGASNSSVSMSGNQVAAEAYGNSATNRMTLNALNTGSPTAAVANFQRNDGAITATVTNVIYGVGITGATAVTGSTVRTTGNQVIATAVGNSAVSSILAAPR